MTVASQAIASYDGDAGWDLSEFILDEYLSYDALELQHTIQKLSQDIILVRCWLRLLRGKKCQVVIFLITVCGNFVG